MGRNFDGKDADHDALTARADGKIVAQGAVLRKLPPDHKDRLREENLIHQMRHNAAAALLNRALFADDDEPRRAP